MGIVGFSTYLFDIQGSWIFTIDVLQTRAKNFTRRVSRVKTLDSNVKVTDFGYTAGDRTIPLTLLNITAEQGAILERVIQTHRLFVLSINGEVYRTYVDDFSVDNRTVKVNCIISEKVS